MTTQSQNPVDNEIALILGRQAIDLAVQRHQAATANQALVAAVSAMAQAVNDGHVAPEAADLWRKTIPGFAEICPASNSSPVHIASIKAKAK